MNTHSKHLIISLSAIIILMAVLGYCSYLLDPFQILHDSYLDSQKFSSQQRYQVPGIIRICLEGETPYDSVIIGTCLTENFRPSRVSKTLKWGKVVPLSIAGSTPREKYYTTQLALQTGNVNNVLMGIHIDYLKKDLSAVQNGFPEYLYTGSPLQYIYNLDTFKYALYKAINRQEWLSDLDTYNNWMSSFRDDFKTFNSKKTIQKLRSHQVAKHNSRTSSKVKQFPSVDRWLLPLFEKYPETEFVLFLPPYSLAYYAEMSVSEFDQILSLHKYITEETEKYSNVHLYEFTTHLSITTNLANYKSTYHYSESVNNWILENIANDVGLLTVKKWPCYVNQLRSALKNYTPRSCPSESLNPSLFK